ncbi:ABC transporter permease [Campylobacter corcagiensis]|uniref:ABC transporter permease n=1 Tax=Campylobacter corcagiensis TaxID=1448857 RepID=A0A7M1LJ11_9BACT|nr:ABC transporter permease [Campylobacter corcagiensis]QKF64318.1 multidrug resistance ABC transporter, permease protein [Campylobacter corcagiensis]QOQ87495.1 ABC transporter permease [Campylobacter corcagiensis]
MIRRIKAVAIKETIGVFRDVSSILIAFVMPMILLFLMGYAVSLDPKKINYAVVSYENSKIEKSIISNFLGSKYFDLETGRDKNEMLKKLDSGSLQAVLILDPKFSTNYKALLLVDGTEPNTAGYIAKYTADIFSKSFENTPNLEIKSRIWFNETANSSYFLIPGSIAVIMTLIGTLLTALVIAREWERGTMEALLSTPVRLSEILIGKTIPYFFLSLISMFICFVVAYFWYEVPFRGSIGMLILISVFYLFPALSIGLLISTIAKNQFIASMASLIVGFLPAFLISGAVFEIDAMPKALQYLSYAIHARYFVSSLQTIFLVGDLYEILLYEVAGMIGIGMVFIFLVSRRLKRSLD